MRALAALALAVALTTHTRAPSAQDNADELAKKLSNPVASLISVPMQYNIDFDIGSESGTKHYLNVQPVIPRDLSEHTKLITRVIMPVIYQDDVFGNSGDQFGLGDTTPSFFFSPNEPIGGWIVGAGPVFLLPTATDELLGSEKWRRPERSRVAANARGLDLWRVGKPRQVVCGRRRPQRPEQHVHTAIPRQAVSGWPDSNGQPRIELRLERRAVERAGQPRLLQGDEAGLADAELGRRRALLRRDAR